VNPLRLARRRRRDPPKIDLRWMHANLPQKALRGPPKRLNRRRVAPRAGLLPAITLWSTPCPGHLGPEGERARSGAGRPGASVSWLGVRLETVVGGLHQWAEALGAAKAWTQQTKKGSGPGSSEWGFMLGLRVESLSVVRTAPSTRNGGPAPARPPCQPFTQACRRGPLRFARRQCGCLLRTPWRAPPPCPPASRSGCGSPSPRLRRRACR
jgi:hypothetical protein